MFTIFEEFLWFWSKNYDSRNIIDFFKTELSYFIYFILQSIISDMVSKTCCIFLEPPLVLNSKTLFALTFVLTYNYMI